MAKGYGLISNRWDRGDGKCLAVLLSLMLLCCACSHRCAHHVPPPRLLSHVNLDAVAKMRRARIDALANSNPDKLALSRAADASVRDFVSLATSSQHKHKLNAMDAIGLIKLCRKTAQYARIGDIWPHIQKLSLLPAKDERTSCTLIGSVVSCALEAKDSCTAASVWSFLRSSPHLPLQELVATQLLSALQGHPGLVVELVTSLQSGACGAHANAQHFSVAMQALASDYDNAKLVFDLALAHNQVDGVTLAVWSQILQQSQDCESAVKTLALADSLSITPSSSHYTVLLSCAGEIRNLTATKRIHEHITTHAPSKLCDSILLSALLQSYAQGGDFEAAASVFQHAVKHKKVHGVMLVVWCQVLQQQRDYSGALNTLALSDSLAVSPEPAHYTLLLSCAAEMKSLAATQRIHQHMSSHPTATKNMNTLSACVHSFAQCGDLEIAIKVFEEGLQIGVVFDVKGWNCVVNAYTEHGMFKEAHATLERMVAAGVKPTEITALCLLNAASHAGLGLGVRELYNQLRSRFPDLQSDHTMRSCVVDGLARAGLFEEAVVEARALQYDVAWNAVLGAARSHNRLDIGELAFSELKRLCTDNGRLASAHVLMSHIYTANGRDEEAAQMRRIVKDQGLRKLPGESSIEVGGVMHTFRANDTSHPEMQRIVELNDKLHEQLKADGYAPDVVWASRGDGVSNQTKEQALCEHSERFALVYGLLHSDEGQPLTIFKNLRVCGDCHNATKHASKVLNRKLTVKDMNRWHVFENGKCSCGDFW